MRITDSIYTARITAPAPKAPQAHTTVTQKELIDTLKRHNPSQRKRQPGVYLAIF